MDYRALIQNRKSVRQFAEKPVPAAAISELEAYYQNGCQTLLPRLKTGLCVLDKDAGAALEGAAGYERFLVGALNYLVLLSESDPLAGISAGYLMEDLVLKLTEMGLDTCWLTFTDSAKVKAALRIDSALEVAAIAAFGFGVKAAKRLRLNILSMSKVDVSAKRRYFAPKRGLEDLVFLNDWGNRQGVDEYVGFYDDMLWEALYAAALSPSYLNRQPYGFVIKEGRLYLVKAPDRYAGEIDANLSLGIVLLHFTAVAAQWSGGIAWDLAPNAPELQLPAGYEVVAACDI